MDDLISKQALKEDLLKRGFYPVIVKCALEAAPTVDAVALPLKIGEKVFCLHHSKSEILEDVVADYDIWSIKNGIKLRISLEKNNSYVIGEFGRGIFRTKEEAEKALEERTNK